MNTFEIATYHDTTSDQYPQVSKFKLYSDLSVEYSWWIPEANSFSQEKRNFQDLPENIQVELAAIAQQHDNYDKLSLPVKEILNQKVSN